MNLKASTPKLSPIQVARLWRATRRNGRMMRLDAIPASIKALGYGTMATVNSLIRNGMLANATDLSEAGQAYIGGLILKAHEEAMAMDPTATPCVRCMTEHRTATGPLGHLGVECIAAEVERAHAEAWDMVTLTARDPRNGVKVDLARLARLAAHRECGHATLNNATMTDCELDAATSARSAAADRAQGEIDSRRGLSPDALAYLAASRSRRCDMWNVSSIERRGIFTAAEIRHANDRDAADREQAERAAHAEFIAVASDGAVTVKAERATLAPDVQAKVDSWTLTARQAAVLWMRGGARYAAVRQVYGDAALVNSVRTDTQLIRRGLMQNAAIGQQYGISPTGRAALDAMRAEAEVEAYGQDAAHGVTAQLDAAVANAVRAERDHAGHGHPSHSQDLDLCDTKRIMAESTAAFGRLVPADLDTFVYAEPAPARPAPVEIVPLTGRQAEVLRFWAPGRAARVRGHEGTSGDATELERRGLLDLGSTVSPRVSRFGLRALRSHDHRLALLEHHHRAMVAATNAARRADLSAAHAYESNMADEELAGAVRLCWRAGIIGFDDLPAVFMDNDHAEALASDDALPREEFYVASAAGWVWRHRIGSGGWCVLTRRIHPPALRMLSTISAECRTLHHARAVLAAIRETCIGNGARIITEAEALDARLAPTERELADAFTAATVANARA